MIAHPLRLQALSLVGLLVSAPAWAAETAHEWLAKMTRATRTLDYEGIFVYQHEFQIETMRIAHKVIDGAPQERLVSLNGMPREIIRNAREVHFYYPNDNTVIVEKRPALSQDFPSILPERLTDLNENYVIQLGKQGRVAGRRAQQVLIGPRDGYRYGYHLWADADTGLLLKADLVNEKNRTLEQFVFTHINIGGTIPASALAPEMVREGMIWHRNGGVRDKGVKAEWIARRLPKGFKLSTQMKREIPMQKKSVEHLVYSDGLAAVSVFIEKRNIDDKNAGQTKSQLGAVNAYSARVDGYHVITMGEVPAATVSLIGDSVARQP